MASVVGQIKMRIFMLTIKSSAKFGISVLAGLLLAFNYWVITAGAPPVSREPMPTICRVSDPRNIDGVCWDGERTIVFMRAFSVVAYDKETYLVGWPE